MSASPAASAPVPAAVPVPASPGPDAVVDAALTAAAAPVEFVDVVKDYGSHRALLGFELSLAAGEMVALLGPSGCGKTTALRSLAGLESITSGAIRIGGEDVAGIPAHRRDIGMVFQSYSLFPHLTVLQNVEYGLRTRRVPREERRERASAMLEMVGLAEKGERFAHELSGGQQQRVALARALVTRPRVLLLDEPLSALDAKVRVQLREEIRRIQTELGITTLFVTHDQEEALAVADRVAVMRAGVIEQIGTPEELYLAPQTRFVAEFVGVSNRLAATVVETGADAPAAVAVFGEQLAVLGALPEGEAWRAYLRPEDLRLVPAGTGIPVQVLTTSFLGSIRRTLVRLPDGETAIVQHGAELVPLVGEEAGLRLGERPVMVAAG